MHLCLFCWFKNENGEVGMCRYRILPVCRSAQLASSQLLYSNIVNILPQVRAPACMHTGMAEVPRIARRPGRLYICYVMLQPSRPVLPVSTPLHVGNVVTVALKQSYAFVAHGRPCAPPRAHGPRPQMPKMFRTLKCRRTSTNVKLSNLNEPRFPEIAF